MSSEQDWEGSQDLHAAPLIAKIGLVLANEELYKRMLQCGASDAQLLLDSFQRLLDMPNMDRPLRKSLIVATERLSKRSGLFPACYELKDVVQDSQHPVAQGGFADIYKGNFQGKTVCLKTIRLYEDTLPDQVIKQISKEAILWSQLSHPNILAIYGIFRLQGRICIISPWMENGNVTKYLKDNPATPRLPLAVDVAEGLLYLHENGIIHGNLKGPNILIDGAGRARLADFDGILKYSVLPWGWKSTFKGNTRWKAPELFDVENDEVVEHSAWESDIYAWGCVVYELFTGQVPFTGMEDNAVIACVTSGGRPHRPPSSSQSWTTWGLTEAIWLVMERSWNGEPNERPNFAVIIKYLKGMLSSDTRPMLGTGMLTSQEFRRQISPGMITIEEFDRILNIDPQWIY